MTVIPPKCPMKYDMVMIKNGMRNVRFMYMIYMELVGDDLFNDWSCDFCKSESSLWTESGSTQPRSQHSAFSAAVILPLPVEKRYKNENL